MIFSWSNQSYRLKWLFSNCKNGAWGNEPDGETDVVCIRAADFEGTLGRLNRGNRTLRSIDSVTYEKLELQCGDIILEKSGGGENQLVGRAVLFDGQEPSITSNFLARCRPAPSMDPAFINYLLLAIYNARGTFPHLKQSIGIQNLDQASFLDTRINVPPLNTQRLIARYLNEKTVLIDRLIAKKRKLLELLSEKRQALINLAVTMGISDSQQSENSGNCSTQRRNNQVAEGANSVTDVSDSNLQAYGKVPLGWNLEKLKFFADIRNSNVDKTISEDEQPVRLCNYTDIYYNDHITSNIQFMEGSATEAEIERFQLRRNQVIITKDSESWDDIGIPALVTEDMPDVLCGYHLSVFEAGSDLDGAFLAWLCRSESLNDQFKLAANGVTRFGLSQYAMKNAFIMFPSLDTQRRIAEFLDKETSQIDELVMKIRESIALLEEYRSAQITAIVKGQITEFQ